MPFGFDGAPEGLRCNSNRRRLDQRHVRGHQLFGAAAIFPIRVKSRQLIDERPPTAPACRRRSAKVSHFIWGFSERSYFRRRGSFRSPSFHSLRRTFHISGPYMAGTKHADSCSTSSLVFMDRPDIGEIMVST
jgi:hypothetical protein